MLGDLRERLRAFAHRGLEGDGRKQNPKLRHALNAISIVNEMVGRPIRGADETIATRKAGTGNGVGVGVPAVATATAAPPAAVPTPVQAPVVVYFDGKDHRTKAKVEELLRGRQIVFQVLDVTDDEAERSWVTTTAKQTELPIVVIAGTPVGGLAELTQLDLDGELQRRVFGLA
jgi:glutaredoxin